MNIAAAYIRVSDDRQDEYSPDSKLKLVREFAKKNDFYIPDEFVFYDDGISAKTAKRRSEFKHKLMGVLEIIKNPDTSEQVKNDVLRTVISKIVFNKAENSLDLFFTGSIISKSNTEDCMVKRDINVK